MQTHKKDAMKSVLQNTLIEDSFTHLISKS